MKRLLLSVAIIMGLASISTMALEIESYGVIGNYAFDTEKESSLGAAGKAFSANLWGGGALNASERMSDSLSFSAGFERDAILRNIVYTRIAFDSTFAKLTVGPFFGPFNTDDSVLTSGLSTTLKLELPGVVFGSVRSDSTIGAGLSAPGDYVQERSEIALGFWLTNVIVTLRLASDTFSNKKTAALTVVDERIRYEFVADVFKKNVPYTARLNIGYQTLSRSYIGSSDTDTDEIDAAIIGFQFKARVTSVVSLLAGIEAPLYAWGTGDLQSPGSDVVFFEGRFGVILTFPQRGTNASDQGQ